MSFCIPVRRWRATAAAVAALVLAACGGSTSQFESFVAERVFAFGDESSTLTDDGRRYGINGVNSETGAIDCSLQPIWVQVVAGFYGLPLERCNTSSPSVEPKAFMLAAAGARVADVAAQIDARVAAGGFRDRDLALMLVGMNDIIELYQQYPARSELELTAEARARGEAAAAQVNRLIDLGAKVIVSNLPDMGMTPYARAEAEANATSGFDRAAFISRLTAAFNDRLGVRIRIDGRFVGLVQMDLRTQQVALGPSFYGFDDISTGVCTVALPDCTTATLAEGKTAAGALWADATRLGSGGQSSLATLALQRAQGNPF
jgi:outer membrane lipase/esterase